MALACLLWKLRIKIISGQYSVYKPIENVNKPGKTTRQLNKTVKENKRNYFKRSYTNVPFLYPLKTFSGGIEIGQIKQIPMSK